MTASATTKHDVTEQNADEPGSHPEDAGSRPGESGGSVSPAGRAGEPRPVVLLGAQLVFNVGFFAVVPFLAGILRDELALAGAAVGLVLGARTAAQQGLFLFGGALADRFGARGLILVGCAVRVSGFATLAWSTLPASSAGLGTRVALFVAGTLLTGMGGALFSPALEVLVARAEAARPATARPRATLFALLAVFGEVGAAIGPVAGALLLGWGFSAVAASGAVLFVVVGGLLALLLPSDRATRRAGARDDAIHDDAATADRAARGREDRSHAFAVLRDRRFLGLAMLASVNLLAYNQLYLGFPIELERAGLGEDTLALVFVVVSVLTITLQLPAATFAQRHGERRMLRVGYLLLAAAFAVLAIAAPFPAGDGMLAAAPALLATTLLTLGHLVLGPLVLSIVPRCAPERRWGSYYGLLATCGGLSVLVGNVLLGALYPLAATVSPAAIVPWLVLAALPVVPALLVPRLVPPRGGRAPSH